MKIVLNKCFGGYSLSKDAYAYLDLNWDDCGFAFEDDRTNPKLISAIETLEEKAFGENAELKIINIPDEIDFEILSYEGIETVVEKGHFWR